MYAAEKIPELVPNNASFEGFLDPRTDLRIDFPEPTGVSYLDGPMRVFRSSTENGDVRFDVIPDHPALEGNELVSFLGSITSRISSPSLYGTIADWDIVDRAALSADKNINMLDEEAERLVQLHSNMGKPWAEFMKSRGRFLAVATADRVPSELLRESDFHRGEILHGRDLSAERLIREFDGSVNANIFEKMIDCLEAEDFEDARKFVFNAIDGAVNAKRNPRLDNPDAILNAFTFGNWKRRKKVLGQIMAELPKETRLKIGEALLGKVYREVCVDGDSIVYMPAEKLDAERGVDVHTKTAGNYAAEFVTIHLSNGRTKTLLKRGSVRKVKSSLSIEPALSWERNPEGERTFVIERATKHEDGVTIFRDGVMGILLAAYMSRDVTEQWPQTMSIRGSRMQFIDAAQVPVLALMRQGELLKSDLIEAAESI